MTRKLLNIFLTLPFLMVLACSDDMPDLMIENPDMRDEVPVEFSIFSPEDFSTRGDGVDNPKVYFHEGEVMHVEAAFYDNAGSLIERKYQALQIDAAGVWKQIGMSTLTWPSDSKRGEFKAFFVKKFQLILEKKDIPEELSLSGLEDVEEDEDADPLMATTDVEWGHRVNLRFKHLCTHLSFTGLDPDITDYFWLVNNKTGEEFHNTFTLQLKADNILEYKFISKPDNLNNKLVYVQSKTKTIYDGNIKTGSQVKFFLEPGDYSDIELRTINNYSYLSYKSDMTASLQGNKSYIIDIVKNKGITFIEENKPWDEDPDAIVELDPDEFLQKIVDGEDYEITDEEGEKKKILQSTSNGTLLCSNVSFKNTPLKEYEMPTGKYFDGGNHFISDLTTNLFSINHGTIQHLGLKNVRCNGVELWYDPEIGNKSRWGALCELNDGVVDNIRLKDVSVSFSIGLGKDEPGYVFNIGTLVGSNTGTISNIEYDGDIEINNVAGLNAQTTVNIGGLIGQSTGFIKEINPLDDTSKITVINTIKGELSTLFVGGAIGQSTANLQDISLTDVLVDSSGGSGLVGNTGGLVGRLRGTTGAPSLISSCTVSGIVKGVPVLPVGTYKAYSYTGGITGYNYNYDVKDCRTLCSVEMNPNVNLSDGVTYGTGGGFGRIINVPEGITITGNYILGSGITGPDYKGNFAGIVPSQKTWVDDYQRGNVVRDILEGLYIGADIDDLAPTD